MKRSALFTLIISLASLTLIFNSCSPPTSGIFWELEREKVITYRNNGLPKDVATSHFQQYTNGSAFFLLIAGTKLYVAPSPLGSASWSAIGTPNDMAVVDVVAVGTNVYAILTGNAGGQAGIPAAIFTKSFTTIASAQTAWTALPTNSLQASGSTPIKLLDINNSLLMFQTDANDSYNIYSTNGSSFNLWTRLPAAVPPVKNLLITAASYDGSNNWLTDQGNIYRLDATAHTFTEFAAPASFSPSTSDQYSDIKIIGSDVYAIRTNGASAKTLANGLGTWTTGSIPYTVTSLTQVTGLTDSDGGTAYTGLFATVKSSGFCEVNASLSGSQTSLISNGNYASTKVKEFTGIFFDPVNPSILYFTSRQQGLWSAVYNSSSGLNFTSE